MKKTSNYTENTNRNHTHKFVRTISVVAVLILILSGITCFQSSAAVKSTGTKVTQAQAKTYSGTYLYCTADDFVALRKSASVSSTELAKIPHGNRMTYLNSKSGKWYYVKYDGKKGYVYEDYVSFDSNNECKSSTKSSKSSGTTKSNSGSSSSKSSGKSSSNSRRSTYYSGNSYSSSAPIKCYYCVNGLEECRCDHGYYHKTEVIPNYGLGGPTVKSYDKTCTRCKGTGYVTCTKCGGDGWR